MVEQLPLHVLAPGIGTDGQVATLVDRGDGILEYQPADPTGGSGGASLGIFNVKDPAYGALGDDSTDDTAAINAAIAALNTAGAGVLYFPPGIYKTTAALTTITAVTTVVGSGCADSHFRQAVTTIKLNSTTAVLFTVGSGAHGTKFSDLNLVNTAGGTPTAGAAIQVLGGDGARYERLTVAGFWINMDMQDGQEWTMDACFIFSPVKYGIKIQHADLPDGGDMGITNCQFLCGDYDADAGIRYESGGGLRLTNCKINTRTLSHFFSAGLDVAIGSGIVTVDLILNGTSFENIDGPCIKGVVTGGGEFSNVQISGGCQFGYYSTTTSAAIDLTGFINVTIGFNTMVARFSGSSAAAVKLTSVTRGAVGFNTVEGFSGGELSETSCTGIVTPGGATALDDLSDVDTSGETAGDVLTFDGTGWVAEAPTGGGTWLVPMTTTIGGGDPQLVFTADGEVLMVEVPAS